MHTLKLIIITVLLLIPTTAKCERKALVIGNANYSFGSLNNSTNDANDIANALVNIGFSVDTVINASKHTMIDSVNDFSKGLGGDDVAFFYYAGHAMQYNDENYLLPVDILLDEEVNLGNSSVKLTDVINQMQRSDLSIVVLDACRDNPYNKYYVSSNGALTRSFRGVSLQPKSGLASTRRAKGTFIAYATDVGSVAFDGNDRNGVFTKYLLKYIKEPGYRLEDVFKRVREEVIKETNEKQIPWDSSSITGVFYFVKPQDNVIKNADKRIFTPAF